MDLKSTKIPYLGDKMEMHCTTQQKASLFDIIGSEAIVSSLEINNISFGDDKGNSRLEISSDRTFLHIYTEDNYVCVAKMEIQDIREIHFTINKKNYTLESYL